MRELLYFINSCLYVYFNSDVSPPKEMAPPQKVAPWYGTLDTHLWVQLWLIFCVYNLGNRSWLCVEIINLHRPSLKVIIKNVWRKLPNFGKNGQRDTMRSLMRGPIQIAKKNMTMGSGPWTQMLCHTKNKVGVIIWLGASGMLMHNALDLL